MKNSLLIIEPSIAEPNEEAMASLWEEMEKLVESRQAALRVEKRKEAAPTRPETVPTSQTRRVRFSHD